MSTITCSCTLTTCYIPMPMQCSMRICFPDVQGLSHISRQADQSNPINTNIVRNPRTLLQRPLVKNFSRIYLDPQDTVNSRCLKTCYPLHIHHHQRSGSELHRHLIPLQGELCTLTHLLLYHANQSELGNRLTVLAISMENAEILSNRLRKSSEKPLGKTSPVNPPLLRRRHQQFPVPCLHPPLLQRMT